MAQKNKNKKRPADINSLAASILEDATDPQPEEPTDKNPAAVSLHFMHYNFARIHRTLRVAPAIEAGISDHVWSLEKIATLLD